jgi:3-hydroxybutyryl-CoA dehydratase
LRQILTVSYFQAIYVRQELRFRAPVKAGNTVVARATVTEIQAERRRVVSTTVCSVEDKVLLDGEATMMASNRPT